MQASHLVRSLSHPDVASDLLEAQGHKPVSIKAPETALGRVRRADEAFGGPNQEAWVRRAEEYVYFHAARCS